jgi:DNA topoisomerase-1
MQITTKEFFMAKKKLLIVESPSKIKTIRKIVGDDYLVKTSFGHIRDMPRKSLGVDLDNGFQPQYEIISRSKKVVSELRKATKNASAILLAMDPDREGEAIAWHLVQVLKPSCPVFRVTFNAITPSAVLAALTRENLRFIDKDLVAAQEVRRVLDRLVGYTVSPLLWNAIEGKGLSAGRVQSVALRVVVERQREIDAFVPQEYWSIAALFQAKQGTFEAKLIQWQGNPPDLKNESAAQAIVAALRHDDFAISALQQKDRFRKPPPPFTTSTLQQAASSHLNFSPNQTMKLAQSLYESGQITYMRTDSVHISPEGQQMAREYIQKEPHLGAGYLPPNPHKFKSKADAQAAHEAIRPTHVDVTHLPEDDDTKAAQLYRLIWSRFVASQMASAIYAETLVTVIPNRQKAVFQAKGSVLKFDGWQRVYRVEEDEEKEEFRQLPPLQKSESLTVDEWKPHQHWTKPPKRYTEASLIKQLEAVGVGRPSTFAGMVETIKARDYVTVKKKILEPTTRGLAVNDFVVSRFSVFFGPDFTGQMEAGLDKIAAHQLKGRAFLTEFWGDFEIALKLAGWVPPATPTDDDPVICPDCGQPMQIRDGKHGRFYGCSGYPQCKKTIAYGGND